MKKVAVKTPNSVMGGQGFPVRINPSPNSKSRPTGSKPFPGGMKSGGSAKGGTKSKNFMNC